MHLQAYMLSNACFLSSMPPEGHLQNCNREPCHLKVCIIDQTSVASLHLVHLKSRASLLSQCTVFDNLESLDHRTSSKRVS